VDSFRTRPLCSIGQLHPQDPPLSQSNSQAGHQTGFFNIWLQVSIAQRAPPRAAPRFQQGGPKGASPTTQGIPSSAYVMRYSLGTRSRK
jgi:hypothetical protein